MTSATRKEREKQRHRAQILNAAEVVFSDKGFHGATMQEIADRAEFSVGYLYNLFQGKEGLYAEVVGRRAREHMSEVEERLRQTEGVLDRIACIVDAKFDFFRRHRKFFEIFRALNAQSNARGPVVLPEAVRERYAQHLGILADVFRDGIEEGVLVRAEPMTLALCLEGMVRATLAHWLYSGMDGVSGEAAALINRVFLHGVLADGGNDE